MLRSAVIVGLTAVLLPALHAQTSPFVGRWDFNITEPNGHPAANWLGIKEKGNDLDIWFQPTGGHVFQVPDYKLSDSHLTLNIGHGLVWELDAKDGKLIGTQKHGGQTIQLTGLPAPELKSVEAKAWTKPVRLFNGKNLDGWIPIGNTAENHWVVRDGDLLNEKRGANLKSDEKFTDFKLHFEVNCPDDANSGFYLRGRYELQLEYEKEGSEPPERGMGAIYGRLAPSVTLPRKVGQWESFDVTLVGSIVTVTRDGTLTIDHKEIEGITGGALDANEGEPGSFYIQGDHTGGLRFRNITVAVPKK
jgi:hypothetical protein